MSDILTPLGVGVNVGSLTKDVTQFLSSRCATITEAELTANSDTYRHHSCDVSLILNKLQESAKDDKKLLEQLNKLQDVLREKEYAHTYLIYKKGYQDAVKSLFCLMAG